MSRFLAFSHGSAAYLTFLGTILYAIGFVTGLHVMNIQASVPSVTDLTAVKTRQQGAWSSGDYAVVGTALQIIGQMLCEAVDRGHGCSPRSMRK